MCDVTEEVQFTAGIQCNRDNNQFLEVTLKKGDQVHTLHDLQKGRGNGSQQNSVIADNYAVFHRLLVLMERCVDVQLYFTYELTPSPAALFKNGFMWTADKPALARRLISGVHCAVNHTATGSTFCTRWWCTVAHSAIGKEGDIW